MNTQTHFAVTSENGSDGPYSIGIEYTVDDANVHRPVLRRNRYGQLTEWRSGPRGSHATLTPCHPPLAPVPFLNLPDEEHGAVWGDPVDMSDSRGDGERWVGDDGEVRCGDWLRAGARRLCGACAQPDVYDGTGCGDLLERTR